MILFRRGAALLGATNEELFASSAQVFSGLFLADRHNHLQGWSIALT
jgi:hypothetical protein